MQDNTIHKIERVNVVQKYGADNEGVLDSTNAIQRVLSEGKIPYLPPGTYLHNGLTLTKPIFGDGATLKYTGTGVGVIFDTPSIKADGITFTSTGLDTSLVKITAPLEVNFHNCEFVGGGGYGIHISGVVHSLIFSGRCTVKNNASHGIFATDIKRASFLGCLISGNGGYGIYFDGYSHGPIFEMNQIWGNLQGGIYLQGEKEGDIKLKFPPSPTSSQHPIFLGNHVDHNQDDVDTTKPSYGIYLDGVDLPILIGNLVRTSRTEGIRIENSTHGLIIGNEIWKVQSNIAINLTSTTSRFTLIGNAYPNGSMIVADPTSHTILGVDTGKNFIYGELSLLDRLSFKGAGGFIKQYASGRHMGNMDIDLNSDAPKTLAVKNGANDLTFDIQGKTLKLQDENGVSRAISIDASGKLVIT